MNLFHQTTTESQPLLKELTGFLKECNDGNMNEHTIQRIPIGKRLRFEVFTRDKFSCRYCGKSSPTVILEIDHVVPVSEGGTNDLHNLATSCFDCNRGKANIIIDSTNVETMPSFKSMEQHRYQVEEFLEYIKFLRETEDELVLKIWNTFGCTNKYDDRMDAGLRAMIRTYGYEETLHSAQIAYSQKYGSMREIYKYFCGVCRNRSNDFRGKNNEKN